MVIGCGWELGQRVRARAPDENASKDRDYRGQVRVYKVFGGAFGRGRMFRPELRVFREQRKYFPSKSLTEAVGMELCFAGFKKIFPKE